MNQKEILFISITIFLTVIAWIIADLSHVAGVKQVQLTNQAVGTQINVSVDKEIFSILNEKKP